MAGGPPGFENMGGNGGTLTAGSPPPGFEHMGGNGGTLTPGSPPPGFEHMGGNGTGGPPGFEHMGGNVASVAMAMAESLAMVVMQPPSSYLSCPSLLKKVLGCLCPRQHRAVLQVRISLYLLAQAFSACHTFPCPGLLFSAHNITMVKT